MDPKQRDRLIGYIDAMTEMENKYNSKEKKVTFIKEIMLGFDGGKHYE